jgi:hypothetical protein
VPVSAHVGNCDRGWIGAVGAVRHRGPKGSIAVAEQHANTVGPEVRHRHVASLVAVHVGDRDGPKITSLTAAARVVAHRRKEERQAGRLRPTHSR